jgi:uncharacterized protein Usg
MHNLYGLATNLPGSSLAGEHFTRIPWEERAVTDKGRLADAGFKAQLAGFSLTTAEILYRLPDHPALLQSYIWQDYDMAPRFPKLKTFLDFWADKLDGKLFRVTVAHARLIRPAEFRLVGAEFRVH